MDSVPPGLDVRANPWREPHDPPSPASSDARTLLDEELQPPLNLDCNIANTPLTMFNVQATREERTIVLPNAALLSSAPVLPPPPNDNDRELDFDDIYDDVEVGQLQQPPQGPDDRDAPPQEEAPLDNNVAVAAPAQEEARNGRALRSFWHFARSLWVNVTPGVLMLPENERYVAPPVAIANLPVSADTQAQRVIFDNAMRLVMEQFPAPTGCSYERFATEVGNEPELRGVIAKGDRVYRYILDCNKPGHRDLQKNMTPRCKAPKIKVLVVATTVPPP